MMASREKIESPREEQQKSPEVEQSPFGGWGGVIVFTMVVAAVLFGAILIPPWLADRAEQDIYNNFVFTRSGPFWRTEVQIGNQPYSIEFRHHPRDVDNISLDPEAIGLLLSKPDVVIITLDPEADNRLVIAGVEISKLTGTRNAILNISTRSALTRPPAEDAEAFVVTCDQASENVSVIWLREGERTRVAQERNCILIEGASPTDVIRAADRLAYGLLGIIR